MGILGQQLLIDIDSEEGMVCQNGTREASLGDTGAPPFPLHAPSAPPPYPHHARPVTLRVPFWHSSGCPGHSEAGRDCGVSEEAM